MSCNSKEGSSLKSPLLLVASWIPDFWTGMPSSSHEGLATEGGREVRTVLLQDESMQEPRPLPQERRSLPERRARSGGVQQLLTIETARQNMSKAGNDACGSAVQEPVAFRAGVQCSQQGPAWPSKAQGFVQATPAQPQHTKGWGSSLEVFLDASRALANMARALQGQDQKPHVHRIF
eukprot:CAMPEP_0117650822 /NCGR_PEP_ID=MMETSP0804-20121206/1748_1 /TAXON_ID=1074897 /ORGANISM="Tetraselmis astigmatica, Strain CCMP880" /LENGTH=177 /DNA_ID=CAMNT_0005456727 /DNA_START=1799 /DNA_END=2333 /DNA_ORIENTATION=-